MEAKDTHGVVVVRASTDAIHRPNTGYHHGADALASAGDWELFPNFTSAREAGHWICVVCFPREAEAAG